MLTTEEGKKTKTDGRMKRREERKGSERGRT